MKKSKIKTRILLPSYSVVSRIHKKLKGRGSYQRKPKFRDSHNPLDTTGNRQEPAS